MTKKRQNKKAKQGSKKANKRVKESKSNHQREVEKEMERLEKQEELYCLKKQENKKPTTQYYGIFNGPDKDQDGNQNKRSGDEEKSNNRYKILEVEDRMEVSKDSDSSDDDIELGRKEENDQKAAKKKVIEHSSDKEETTQDTNDDDDTVKIVTVVNGEGIEGDKVGRNKTPERTRKESENPLSIDSEATNPTMNKNSTKRVCGKEVGKSCEKRKKEREIRAKKQLQMPIEIKRNHRLIYSLKLAVQKNSDPMKTMQHILRDWFKRVREHSPSFVVYKWKDETYSQAITCADSINANVFHMKQYFSGVRPKEENGFIWSTIHAGHNKVYDSIKKNNSWWLSKTDSGMFKKNLQFHDTERPIWLLWSHEQLDNEALKEKWDEKALEMYGEEFPMALNHTYVSDGAGFKESKGKKKDELKALHVETPKDKVEK